MVANSVVGYSRLIGDNEAGLARNIGNPRGPRVAPSNISFPASKNLVRFLPEIATC
jgi:hypothetical protein